MEPILLVLGGLGAYAFLKGKGAGRVVGGGPIAPHSPASGTPLGRGTVAPILPVRTPGSGTSPADLGIPYPIPPGSGTRLPAPAAPPVPTDTDWLPDRAAVTAYVQAYAQRGDRLGRSLTDAELQQLATAYGYTGGPVRKSLLLPFLERQWAAYRTPAPVGPTAPPSPPAPVPQPSQPAGTLSEAEAIAYINNYAWSIGAVPSGVPVPADILQRIATKAGYSGQGWIAPETLRAAILAVAQELGYGAAPAPAPAPAPAAPAPVVPAPVPAPVPTATRQPYTGGIMSWPDDEVVYAATHPQESADSEWQKAPQERARRPWLNTATTSTEPAYPAGMAFAGGQMAWSDQEVAYAASHPTEHSFTEWTLAPAEAQRRAGPDWRAIITQLYGW